MFKCNLARREFITCSAVGVVVAASAGKLVGAESAASVQPLAKPDGSVESDRYANGGLRVQASCMAMGQAAGAAAALAAQANKTPLDVPLENVRELLRKHGAIIPGTLGGG